MFFKYKNIGTPMPIKKGLFYDNREYVNPLRNGNDIEYLYDYKIFPKEQNNKNKIDLYAVFLTIRYDVALRAHPLSIERSQKESYILATSHSIIKISEWIEARFPNQFIITHFSSNKTVQFLKQ